LNNFKQNLRKIEKFNDELKGETVFACNEFCDKNKDEIDKKKGLRVPKDFKRQLSSAIDDKLET